MAPEARAAHPAAGTFSVLSWFCVLYALILLLFAPPFIGFEYPACGISLVLLLIFFGKIYSLAASLLPPGASTVGFGGYLGSSKIDTSSSSSVEGGAPSLVCFCTIYH